MPSSTLYYTTFLIKIIKIKKRVALEEANFIAQLSLYETALIEY